MTSPPLLSSLVSNVSSAEVDKFYGSNRWANLSSSESFGEELVENLVKSAEMNVNNGKIMDGVVLKYLLQNNEDVLKQFLLSKLDCLTLPRDVSQISLIAIWLVEIVTHAIGREKSQDDCSSQICDKFRDEFQNLISNRKIRDCLIKNKRVVYDIILNQGEDEFVILFATFIQDYRFLLDYFFEREDFSQCIQLLRNQRSPELTYQYAPLLLRKAPEETCEILIDQYLSLELDIILPTLIQGTDQESLRSPQCQALVKYLEHCVAMGITKQIVHNSLVTIYTELDIPKLLNFLEVRNEYGRVYYDIDYALKVCFEKNLKKACVILYNVMEDYENAVEIALQVDIDLAKKTANLPQMNDELRRELWLKIARKLIEERKDVVKVSQLLNECDLLKIEDILPSSPDFVVIDHLKDAVCSSLSDYLQQLKDFEQDIEEVTDNAHHISQEILSLRDRSIVIREDDKCAICGHSALSLPFHAFPCHHMYHTNCLHNEIQNFTGPSVLERLRKIQSVSMLDPLEVEKSSSSLPNDEELGSEQIKEIMQSQCLYCGDVMIESINMPLISPEEQTMALTGW
ncbi:vacuolar protein sorting-associated protein 18 dor [Brevipalpus obovatus]|uniref:vacuolar protein sorting-associated protein 18 dor n=1 Tax=Brevipalpus obovatus TaxID=246614 RepID=UPI003D9F6AE7